MSIAQGMRDLETRTSTGFCGECNKVSTARWDRIGNRLVVSCEDCGQILIEDKNRFKSNKIKEATDEDSD
jgi:hypothetical protein